MSEPTITELILKDLAQIKRGQDDGFRAINDRLDAQNGRLRTVEVEQGEQRGRDRTLKWIIGVTFSVLGIAIAIVGMM